MVAYFLCLCSKYQKEAGKIMILPADFHKYKKYATTSARTRYYINKSNIFVIDSNPAVITIPPNIAPMEIMLKDFQ